jgi:uncharacterized surface protein with fasciclin (FAS1) repeats
MKTLRSNSKSLAIAMILSVAIFAASCNKDEATAPNNVTASETLKNGNGAPAPGDKSIAQIAIENGFSELVNALTYVDTALDAGLVELFLNGKDQYTVFAPTNDAFFNLYGALEVDEITDLPAPLVLDVLYYHVTEGRRASNSVVPKRGIRTIQTLLGESFSVDPQAMITAIGNTAYITAPDISASNGIVHIIDAVILPIEVE